MLITIWFENHLLPEICMLILIFILGRKAVSWLICHFYFLPLEFQKVAIYNDLAYLKDSKKKFIHPVFIKSLPAKGVIATETEDDDELLMLEDVKPQQTKI